MHRLFTHCDRVGGEPNVNDTFNVQDTHMGKGMEMLDPTRLAWSNWRLKNVLQKIRGIVRGIHGEMDLASMVNIFFLPPFCCACFVCMGQCWHLDLTPPPRMPVTNEDLQWFPTTNLMSSRWWRLHPGCGVRSKLTQIGENFWLPRCQLAFLSLLSFPCPPWRVLVFFTLLGPWS